MPPPFERVPRELRPYRCSAVNMKTGHPCRTVLIEAWAPSGALVRRRCKQCGTWATVEVQPESAEEPRAVPPARSC